MRPLDDELRALLTSRADSVPLVPDPIVGIEQRARRMRRNRVTAAVAGTVLAVSAVAVAVPALTTSSNESLPQYAPEPTAPATAEPSPQSPYALDPTQPWNYRGDSSMYDDGSFESFQREWAVRHPGSRLLPLFGQVYEPSAQFELVFAARDDSTGEARWGVVQSSEGGPAFLVDAPLDEADRLGLAVALAGDEAARLLVVAAPRTTVDYDPPSTAPAPMTALAGGVAVGPLLQRDQDGDQYVVRAPEGAVLKAAEAPDPPSYSPPTPAEAPVGEGPGSESAPPLSAPGNVVDWPVRGQVSNELYLQALRAYAREAGSVDGEADAKVLYAGSREGRNLMLLQAWLPGQDARTFGYLEAAGNESTWLGAYTAPGPAVLAFLVPAEAALLPNDLLVVVPEPAAGQVLYSPDGSSEPQPVPDQGTEVAVLVDRAPGASGDRLLVLDGDGDPDRPIYRGTVEGLLATF